MGGVVKIYDEPHRSGVFKVYDSRKACLNIYDEPASPNRGPCLRSMIAGIAKSGACLNIYDEPASPNRGACLRYMTAGIAK